MAIWHIPAHLLIVFAAGTPLAIRALIMGPWVDRIMILISWTMFCWVIHDTLKMKIKRLQREADNTHGK